MPQVLQIAIEFPHGIYSGAVLGVAEDLPEPSRVYEALVAGAAGGPAARPEDNVLVACEEHRAALEWLEQHEPLGLIAPRTMVTRRTARRYRWRASPVSAADTDFEPFSAVDGAVAYLWPPAPEPIVTSLREIAAEVTHVGRADSLALVEIENRDVDVDKVEGGYRVAEGRGPGRVMRIPRPGRCEALVCAHREASRRGGHGTGSLGKQAADELVTGANSDSLSLRRFATARAGASWPYEEVWVLPITRSTGGGPFVGSDRVAAAVGIHRALIARVGDDVPPLVTGRDGDGPSRGTGHLVIQLGPDPQGDDQVVLLGLPVGVPEADRRRLSEAVRAPFRAGARIDRGKTVWFTVEPPCRRVEANRFWRTPARLMRTAVPFVVEINGGPRRQTWTLDDATVCSIGFAMRSLLEPTPLGWGAGWAFRTELVRTLRDDYGVDARAIRFRGPSSRLAYKMRAGELIVAAHAIVDLGRLAGSDSAGFLALGRTRHLGGGLLLPVQTTS